MIRVPPLPPRIGRLPRDHRGYPVPWFVGWADPEGSNCEPGCGRPRFSEVPPERRIRAVRERRCWLCGERLDGRRGFTFVVAPISVATRVTLDPPCHPSCADFATRYPAFVLNPERRRDLGRLPEGAEDAPGCRTIRDPAVRLLWRCRGYETVKHPSGLFSFRLGVPVMIDWRLEGRAASRAEALASVEASLEAFGAAAKARNEEALERLRSAVQAAASLPPD